MTSVLRYLTGFFSADNHQPGLIQKPDGTVWLVNPDGSETQLGGGGGSGILSNGQSATTQIFATPNDFSLHPVQVIGGGNLVGGEAPAGLLGGFSYIPPVFFFAGTFLDLNSGQTAVSLAGTIAEVDDPFSVGIDVVCFVSDGDGTNRAHSVITGEIDAPITDLAYTADFSTAAWTIDAGDDLSAIGPALTSAAGGIYSIWLGVQASIGD